MKKILSTMNHKQRLINKNGFSLTELPSKSNSRAHLLKIDLLIPEDERLRLPLYGHLLCAMTLDFVHIPFKIHSTFPEYSIVVPDNEFNNVVNQFTTIGSHFIENRGKINKIMAQLDEQDDNESSYMDDIDNDGDENMKLSLDDIPRPIGLPENTDWNFISKIAKTLYDTHFSDVVMEG